MKSIIASLALIPAASASAGLLFADNFNSENGGVANNGTLNYNSFSNWSVSDGTVDLIGNGYFDFGFAANELFIDLDGSTGNAGVFSTSTAFTFEAGVQYELKFELAGNQRVNTNESVDIDIGLGGLLDETIVIGANDAFTEFVFTFVGDGSSGMLQFENLGGDNIGALLDNVQLSAVPLPQTGVLAGVGLLGVAGLRRRR
jgi:hypothetical protein